MTQDQSENKLNGSFKFYEAFPPLQDYQEHIMIVMDWSYVGRKAQIRAKNKQMRWLIQRNVATAGE